MGTKTREKILDGREVVDRRSVLAKAIWGGAGIAAAATTGSVALASSAGASSRRPKRTVVYDVACLLNTFTPIVADGSTAPETNFRGTTFFVEGELYPAGTIPDGVVDFDPASAAAIGHWMCRGWFVNRSGRQGEVDRVDPHVITQQEYYFNRITEDAPFPTDQLSSSGLEGDAVGRATTRSVVGGAGMWHGATGSVVQEVIGANLTAGPNFRFTFDLGKQK